MCLLPEPLLLRAVSQPSVNHSHVQMYHFGALTLVSGYVADAGSRCFPNPLY